MKWQKGEANVLSAIKVTGNRNLSILLKVTIIIYRGIKAGVLEREELGLQSLSKTLYIRSRNQ